MSLVNGYDSDSDSDVEVSSSRPGRGLSGLLPPPISQRPSLDSPSGSRLSASSPISTAAPVTGDARIRKRKIEKRQIKIDALDALSSGDDDSINSKKAKVESDGGSNSRSSLAGLMGMLPAPKKRPSPDPKVESNNVQNNIGLSDDLIGTLAFHHGATEGKKVKGNDDFRAMLGLKPSNTKPKAESSIQDKSKSPAVPLLVSEPSFVKSTGDNVSSIDQAEREKSRVGSRAGLVVSSAPQIEDEIEFLPASQAIDIDEDQYKGWQQGPDGNWFPVTPEAHAAYNEYLALQWTQAQEFKDRPADMQFDEGAVMHSADANASRQTWLSRPSTEADPSSSELDRKYAMAAASLATPDQGIPLVDQEEEVKKMDKKTNFRARRKGQLSALIAQAEENRGKLEEKWSRGKDGRHAAKEKYGF